MKHGPWGKENYYRIQAVRPTPQLFSSQETRLQAGALGIVC